MLLLLPTKCKITGLVGSQSGPTFYSSVPTSLHYLPTYLHRSVVDFICFCRLVENWHPCVCHAPGAWRDKSQSGRGVSYDSDHLHTLLHNTPDLCQVAPTRHVWHVAIEFPNGWVGRIVWKWNASLEQPCIMVRVELVVTSDKPR